MDTNAPQISFTFDIFALFFFKNISRIEFTNSAKVLTIDFGRLILTIETKFYMAEFYEAETPNFGRVISPIYGGHFLKIFFPRSILYVS